MADERKLVILLALSVCLNNQMGCDSYNHQVIAATGTSIGVEVSQNPATQVPQAKLGYQRAELAIVPTNRSAEKTTTPGTATTTGNSMGGGASDHGEVIMELRYGGIFDMGKSSGIYQRLAVGKTAVAQPGAAFMFAKDDEGELKGNTADAVARAAEAAAFAEKLSGKAALSNIAFLTQVRAGLVSMDKDPKAKDLVKKLDGLSQALPDLYEYNRYVERPISGLPVRNIRTDKKKGSSNVDKSTKTIIDVTTYQGQLLESIGLLESLMTQNRTAFVVDCTEPAANCDRGVPDIPTLQKELNDQKEYLQKFSQDWAKKDIVLQSVDYYIAALKK